MVATIIRLPEEELELYKEYAYRNGISVAEFFRVSARKVVSVKPKKSKHSFFDLGTKVVFKGNSPKDGSTNHDKYYYEFEDRKMHSK
jgi:hypothetical protein